MFFSFVPVHAEDKISNINMPTSNCELGYIFSVSDNNFNGLNPDDYDGIAVISEELNIYYAVDLQSFKNIASKFDIADYEENFIIETPDLPEEDFSQEVSLFDIDDIESNEPEPSIEPVSSEEPTETIVPVTTETPNETEEPSVTAIPEETVGPQSTDEPVETETPENTEEPSETIEPTQTETPEETSSPVEPTVEPEPTPNDLLYNWQWYYEAVNANTYRENNITGKSVKVGIIDSGIRTDREDFEGVDIETGLNVCAYVMNDEDRLYSTIDAENHGTAVASIIAAKSNNSVGITGMVDGCTLVPFRIEDNSYSKSGLTGVSLIKAIQLAYDNGCDVVNISYGGTMSSDIYINQIVDNCIKDGMIIIAAAGNSGNKENLNEIEYPAACTNVIGVGAVQPDCEQSKIRWIKSSNELVDPDIVLTGTGTGYYYVLSTIKDLSSDSYVKCDFSTANESVFISAPGKDMMILSNQSSSEYHLGNGTSYATPIVTAAVAGIKQMRPYVDTDMVKEILKATAVDLDEDGYDVNTGYGMVDFEAIYNYVSEMPETIPEETPEIQIDYVNNMLTGFDEDVEYLINDVAIVPEEDSIAIDDSWYGNTMSIVRKSRGNGYSDSEAQELNIPAIPDTPIGVSAGYNKISGTTTDMQYKSSASDTWISCSGTEIVNLDAGTYDVRTKATTKSFASKSVQVEVLDLPIKPTTPPLEKEYTIETSVYYDETNNRVVFSTTNNTENTIYATGVVAVYDTNGILKYIKTIKTFPKGTLNQSFAYGDANCKIKFFIWKDLQSLQPYPDVKCSEYSN